MPSKLAATGPKAGSCHQNRSTTSEKRNSTGYYGLNYGLKMRSKRIDIEWNLQSITHHCAIFFTPNVAVFGCHRRICVPQLLPTAVLGVAKPWRGRTDSQHS